MLKITSNKTKHLLAENELNKLKTFDSSYYNGKSYFEEDGTSIYLIFQPLNKYKVTFNHGKIVNIFIVNEVIRIANINCNRN